MDNYINCFPAGRRVGRFFRKLSTTREGTIKSTEQVIGKETAAKYGKRIAHLLHLSEPNTYTGHTWRRTSITFMANSGLSLAQIKSVSGHKSDTVVQGYIDKSMHMQTTTAQSREVRPRSDESQNPSLMQISAQPQPSWQILSNVSATTVNVYIGQHPPPTSYFPSPPSEPTHDSLPSIDPARESHTPTKANEPVVESFPPTELVAKVAPPNFETLNKRQTLRKRKQN